jgi:hypothetical protein
MRVHICHGEYPLFNGHTLRLYTCMRGCAGEVLGSKVMCTTSNMAVLALQWECDEVGLDEACVFLSYGTARELLVGFRCCAYLIWSPMIWHASVVRIGMQWLSTARRTPATIIAR